MRRSNEGESEKFFRSIRQHLVLSYSESIRDASYRRITLTNAAFAASAVQFLGRFRDCASLIARAGEFIFGRLAAAVCTGNRGGSIRRAAGNLKTGTRPEIARRRIETARASPARPQSPMIP